MIEKAALLLFKGTGTGKKIMFVRAYGKKFLVLPGGKQEADETTEQALSREIAEELACSVKNISHLEKVHGFTPEGKALVISLFTGTLEGTPKPSSEIEEIIWLSRQDIPKFSQVLTPITKEKIFPCLAQYNLF